MPNVTSTTQVPTAVNNYYDKLLLARAKPKLIHTQFAQTRNIPSKSTDTIKFRRYTNLATATTALAEGVTPSGHALSVTDMTAQVEQYGSYLTITDKVQYIIEDNVLNEGTSLLGQQMGQTVDELVRDILASTLSATNCAAGTNGGTPTELTYSDIQGAVVTLVGQDATMFTPIVEGQNKFGTAPIRDSFWVMADSPLIDDLEAIDEFVSIANYPAQQSIIPGEWGSVGNTRWVFSSVGYVSSSTYSCFLVGENAYAVTTLKEGVSSMIFQQPVDPLKQRSTMGWKHFMAARVLNDNWIIKLNCTHS